MYEEQAAKISEFVSRLKELRSALNVEGTQAEIAKLEQQMSANDFWNDQESAQKIVQKLKAYKAVVTAPEALKARTG